MAKLTQHKNLHYETLHRYARLLGFGEIHTKIDTQSGLQAIIAIHSTQLGPAIGGTRFYNYSSSSSAFLDALRLGYIMTLKAAFNDLPHGGAKAVILKPRIFDRAAIFRSLGDFIQELDGNYITAVDMGTNNEDMNIIAERTPYVFGATRRHPLQTDPSPHTARGVLRGIEAAVKHKLKRSSLEDIHVAIQGAGHVGYFLAQLLHERGAKISISDLNQEAVKQCVEQFNAQEVPLNDIHKIACDVFSPCALGGIINLATIAEIQASIIAGSANAQLAHRKFASVLHEKGILYAPDFIINSGGLIYVAMVYDYLDPNRARIKIDALYDTMLQLFERSEKENIATEYMAEQIAKEKLRGKNSDHTQNDRSI